MLTILLFILGGLFTFSSGFIDILPSLDFTFPADFMTTASDFLNGVAFFLPVGPLLALFEFKLLIISFRMFWALCMRVKSFIPTISGT